MHIRKATRWDLEWCSDIVLDNNWGEESDARLREQFAEYIAAGDNTKWAPEFWVAQEVDTVVGFCGAHRSMMMHGGWHFIWTVVDPKCHKGGIGTLMTEFRLDYIREQGGVFVMGVTQKPKYFNRFGFVTSQDLGGGWVAITAQLKLLEA